MIIKTPQRPIKEPNINLLFGFSRSKRKEKSIKKIGPALFTREDSIFFNKKHIIRAQHFYEQHGRKTIVLARFMPIIRTFAPIVAGIGNMKNGTFLSFNVIGGFLWTWAMLWMGYGLGSLIPDPDRYILPVVIVIIIISASPVLRELLRNRKIKGS